MTTLATNSRNAHVDAFAALMGAGGKIKVYTAGAALLLTFTLGTWGAGSVGVATMGTPPYSAVATGTGTANNYTATKSDGTVVASGPISELALSDTAIVTGVPYVLTGLTYTQPAS